MRTVKFDRVAYAADFKNRHRLYEKKQYKVFKSALDEQVAPVIHYVKAYGSITPAISNMLVTRAPMEAAYKECYVTIGTRHAEYTRRQINRIGREVKSLFSEKWQAILEAFFLNESATRVTEVTETTREKIRQVLSDAAGLNLNMSETATYIVDQLSRPDFNRFRAMVIARTESTTAANKGAMLGNDSADYETVKEWIGVEDSRQRETHKIADGQQVAPNEDFTVGGEFCSYPGDMRLSAAEVIQCRCTVAFVPLLDSDGLPILK